MGKMRRRINLLRLLFIFLFAVFIAVLGSWMQFPYFTSAPGDAIELAPIVSIEDGYRDEKGSLMMTTVSLNRTNLWEYLYAKANPEIELLKLEQVKSPHETDEEYFERQRENMSLSQQKAIAVAFKKAGVEVKVEELGARINYFIPGMPAEKVLKPGDLVVAVDDHPIHTGEELVAALKGKSSGEKVTFRVKRGKETLDLRIEVAPFPEAYQNSGNENRAGVGILAPETKYNIITSKNVDFNTEDIGGPSAGLMFTLELINQLTKGDLTKGYEIAGTGTMEIDGRVGPIGGVQHKIVAAERKGAEIFFAPDVGTPETNYAVAVKTAKAKGLKLKIVPVKTIDDALQYLANLPEKK